MVIAVDIRGSEAYKKFIYETFKILTAKYSEHIFIFIFDKPFGPSVVFSKNVTTVIIKQRRFLSSLLNKISFLLKKYNADVFVTGDTLKIKVPQCLIASDSSSLKFLKKVQRIVAMSQFSKNKIVEKYKVDPNKVDVVYKGVDEIFGPVSFEEKENIKEQYAEGREYFLFCGNINSENNLLNLLKAFSVFKKKQKSGMQLIIASKDEASKEFIENLETFRLKKDVKLLEDIDRDQLAKITAAAYAFVYPVKDEVFIDPVLDTVKCNVPVITGNITVLIEVVGDAALYVNTEDHNDIAEKMMLVFKNEKLRRELIDKGMEQVKKYNWHIAAELLWHSISKSAV